MSQFFNNVFSKYHCGFRKGFSTQQCLLAMLEKWKKSVDNGKAFGTIRTDLLNAFECLDHEFFIAKLNAYGFSLPALKLILDSLSNRKQQTNFSWFRDSRCILAGNTGFVYHLSFLFLFTLSTII